jgi:hypothetical protein
MTRPVGGSPVSFALQAASASPPAASGSLAGVVSSADVAVNADGVVMAVDLRERDAVFDPVLPSHALSCTSAARPATVGPYASVRVDERMSVRTVRTQGIDRWRGVATQHVVAHRHVFQVCGRGAQWHSAQVIGLVGDRLREPLHHQAVHETVTAAPSVVDTSIPSRLTAGPNQAGADEWAAEPVAAHRRGGDDQAAQHAIAQRPTLRHVRLLSSRAMPRDRWRGRRGPQPTRGG